MIAPGSGIVGAPRIVVPDVDVSHRPRLGDEDHVAVIWRVALTAPEQRVVGFMADSVAGVVVVGTHQTVAVEEGLEELGEGVRARLGGAVDVPCDDGLSSGKQLGVPVEDVAQGAHVRCGLAGALEGNRPDSEHAELMALEIDVDGARSLYHFARRQERSGAAMSP